MYLSGPYSNHSRTNSYFCKRAKSRVAAPPNVDDTANDDVDDEEQDDELLLPPAPDNKLALEDVLVADAEETVAVPVDDVEKDA